MFDYILILSGVALLIIFFLKKSSSATKEEVDLLTAEEFYLVDARSPSEFANRHLKEAINLPVGSNSDLFSAKAPDKTRPILVYCQSGMRSSVLAKQLVKNGYIRVLNLGSITRAEKILPDNKAK